MNTQTPRPGQVVPVSLRDGSTVQIRPSRCGDHHDLEAFSAGEPVGVARYVTRHGEPRTADVTVRVVGGYQDTELALLLAARIADQAAEAGTTELVYHMPGSGRRVLDLLWAVGAIPVFEHGRLTGRGPAPLSGQAAA